MERFDRQKREARLSAPFFNLKTADMDRVAYLNLQGQYDSIRTEVLAALEEICESGKFAQGPATSDFEAKFAAYCGVDHCVTLNSGTSALHLALRCLDIKPGDEVITVAMTFIGTAWAISYVGATPVFVDIDPARRTMCPSNLEAAITLRTKAIIPVHLYGMPAEMDHIKLIAERHGLPIIEDAAQAHGARYRGKRVGQFGKIACFSFYPSKNLGAYGEGGALITNDASIAHRARSLRDHAQSQKYLHDEIGYNYRMDSFQAAVLAIKLKRLDAWNAARGSVLHEAGIETAVHYPVPVHLQKAYAHLGYKPGDLPVTEKLCQQCLSLPIYPELSKEKIFTVTSILLKIQS